MKLRAILCGLAVVFLSGLISVSSAAKPVPSTSPRLGVPAYSYPGLAGDFWNNATAVSAGSVFIMNPASGPGQKIDSQYLIAVSKAKRQGIQVFGYVDTAYGNRSVTDIQRDATFYQAWYGVQGIFLDQAALDRPHVAYYHTLSQRLREQKLKVAFNPGQVQIEPATLADADHIVTFEGSMAQYKALSLPIWMLKAPCGKFWHLVYQVSDEASMSQVLNLAKRRNVGVVYVTNGKMPNPWNAIPPYWLKEAQQLH